MPHYTNKHFTYLNT